MVVEELDILQIAVMQSDSERNDASGERDLRGRFEIGVISGEVGDQV